MKMLRLTTIIAALGLIFSAFAGCETSTPGVKNYFGTLKTSVNAAPDKVTDAAKKSLEDLKLADISATGTKVDGKVKGRTGLGDDVRIEIEQAGENVSVVEIRVGEAGDSAVSKQILDGIKEHLK